MGRYRYNALTHTGRSERGLIEAGSPEEVARLLEARGRTAVSVDPVGGWRAWLARETPGDLELADFLDDLAALHRAGVPLRRALDVLSGESVAPRIARLAKLMAGRLDSGAGLSAATRVQDEGAVVLAAELAKAGEVSGRLDLTLVAGARVLRSQAEFAKRIRSALAYPAFLLVLSVFAIVALSVVAGPALAPLMEEVGGETGALGVILGLGAFLREQAPLAIAIVGLCVLGLVWVMRRPRVRRFLAEARAKAPVIRPIVRDLNFGAFAQTFGTLIVGGTPAAKAMDLAGATANNLYWREALHRAAENLREGRTVAGALTAIPHAPSEISHLTSVGEETGTLGEMTIRASEIMLERSLRRLDRVAAAAGPILLVAMGGFIAWVMAGFLGGLASLGDGVI